jgi:hypothetical protein
MTQKTLKSAAEHVNRAQIERRSERAKIFAWTTQKLGSSCHQAKGRENPRRTVAYGELSA